MFAMAVDLEPVFTALRAVLTPHADAFHVQDRKGYYGLDDRSVRGHVVDFAAVVLKRRAVSFYLLPTVWSPALLEGVSDALRARRTKAGFFNFASVAKGELRELSRLVERARRAWDPAALVGR